MKKLNIRIWSGTDWLSACLETNTDLVKDTQTGYSLSESLRAINAKFPEIMARQSELEKIVVGAPESFDTLKEIADWIQDPANIIAGLNIKNGEGSGSIQQKPDQNGGVTNGKFDFTNKNPNTTLTGDIDYGGTGDFATVLGGKAAAMGKRALAHGTTTIAQGDYSHSEGNATVALGANSHAEGLQTTAKSNGAHSEGELTIAGGKYSHAEGKRATSNGDYSHAEGEEAAADGFGSHAEGLRTEADGAYSHAEGQDTKALSDCSHAEGRETEASARFSHAEGYKAKATAEYAHAEGRETEATAYYAHAEGYGTHAQANNSHTEGEGTTITDMAKGAHAEGYYTTVEAQYAHAEGYRAKALTTNALYAHAEGYETEAHAEASHAEGRKTKVTARYAHAEGRETVAEGNFSHAEGYQTATKGEGSHASGRGTIAGQHYQTVTGQYNDNKTDTVFEVGIGTSDTDRKNGLEVYKDGTIKVYDKTTGDTKELQASGGGNSTEYAHSVIITFNQKRARHANSSTTYDNVKLECEFHIRFRSYDATPLTSITSLINNINYLPSTACGRLRPCKADENGTSLGSLVVWMEGCFGVRKYNATKLAIAGIAMSSTGAATSIDIDDLADTYAPPIIHFNAQLSDTLTYFDTPAVQVTDSVIQL